MEYNLSARTIIKKITNGTPGGGAPLVWILGIFFFFSDICTGYKIYYWTEYRQHHTATADSSNTIED